MRVKDIISLLESIKIGNRALVVEGVRRTSIREAVALQVALAETTSREGKHTRLFSMLVFEGREPYYRAWVEIFSISRVVEIGLETMSFAGSVIEEAVLDALARVLGPGERLFIEYLYDDETMRALELGVPAPATRLGYMLFRRGFLWFKDWYFPEGFMEGGPKLQAEKPLDSSHASRLREEIARELQGFIRHWDGGADDIIRRALRRAREVLVELGFQP